MRRLAAALQPGRLQTSLHWHAARSSIPFGTEGTLRRAKMKERLIREVALIGSSAMQIHGPVDELF